MVCHQGQSLVHICCQWGENRLPPLFFYVAGHVKLYLAYFTQDRYKRRLHLTVLRTLQLWRVSLCLALNWGPNRRSRCNSSSTTKRRFISFLKPMMSKQHRGKVLQESLLNSHYLRQNFKCITNQLSSFFSPNRWIDSFKEATVL